MAFIQGLLGLCSGFANGLPLEPNSAYGYSRQPISFGSAPGGIALNDYGCLFGPTVTSGWGVLVGYAVFDPSGNVAWTGTINQPIDTTQNLGEQIVIPGGALAIDLNVPLPGGIVLAGFQPALSAGPSGAFMTAPTVSGGLPSYVTTGAFTAPVADSSYTLFAPSGAGFTYAAPSYAGGVTFTGSGSFNGTISLPAAFSDGAIFRIGSALLTVPILTVSPGVTGTTVYGTAPSLSPSTPVSYRYTHALSGWVRG